MFGLLSTCTTAILGGSLASNSKRRIKCVSLNNRPCQARPKFINVNSKEPLYYSFNVSVNKCGWSCNTIDNLYIIIYVADKVKKYKFKNIKFDVGGKWNKIFSSTWIEWEEMQIKWKFI